MPVAKGPSLNLRRAVVLGVIAVAVGIGLVFLVTRLASTDAVEVQLGDDQFGDLEAESTAAEIDDRGPILFQDLTLGGSRDIYVQHLGTEPESGWYAFDARPPGEPRECQLEWQSDERVFVTNDACQTQATITADGAGLVQYDISVDEDGDVVVDISGD